MVLDVLVPQMVEQLLEVPVGNATKVLQSETVGVEGQMESRFRESSGASLQTSTDLEGLKVATMVRQLAAQLTARISGIIMKFGADTDDDPFVKVTSLVMSLISQLQRKRRMQRERGKKISKLTLRSAHRHLKQLFPNLAYSTVRSLRFSQSWVYCQTDTCRWTSCAQLNGTFSPKSKLTLGKVFRERRRYLTIFGLLDEQH